MKYEFKETKESNKKTVYTFLTEPFWEEKYDILFSPDIVVDLPSAPPGMPQHLDAYDFSEYRSWLARTISNTSSIIQEYYGTPDPEVFWAIRDVSADVKWSRQPGKFSSKIFTRIEMKRGQIIYIKQQWNPLHFLYAIGADIPVFHMDLYNEKVENYLKSHSEPPQSASPEVKADSSPEAIEKRIQKNLNAFRCKDYWYALSNLAEYSPDFESKVWFLPPEMKESYPKDMMARVEAWTALSCPVIQFDEAGKYWATDDPHVYFAEYMCHGITDWVGNNAPNAHYRNRYFYVLRFDGLGRIRVCEEVLNPVNKFNSICVSLPTFPYYY